MFLGIYTHSAFSYIGAKRRGALSAIFVYISEPLAKKVSICRKSKPHYLRKINGWFEGLIGLTMFAFRFKGLS